VRLAALPLALLLTLPAQAATVLSVGDGDTLRVDDRGKRLTIRLACIDAPEMAQSPYGEQSRALLTSLAPVGSDVSLRVVDTDRYGRKALFNSLNVITSGGASGSGNLCRMPFAQAVNISQ
jgi:micrococcal nuclease